MELKLAKPHSANVAIVNERGSSWDFDWPELRVGDEFVERHARAEQVADHGCVTPRHPHRPGHRCEAPAEDLLKTEPDEPEQGVDQRDERHERDQHGADVEREREALAGTAPRRIDHVDVGALDLEADVAHRLGHLGFRNEDLGHHQRAGRGHDDGGQQVLRLDAEQDVGGHDAAGNVRHARRHDGHQLRLGHPRQVGTDRRAAPRSDP